MSWAVSECCGGSPCFDLFISLQVVLLHIFSNLFCFFLLDIYVMPLCAFPLVLHIEKSNLSCFSTNCILHWQMVHILHSGNSLIYIYIYISHKGAVCKGNPVFLYFFLFIFFFFCFYILYMHPCSLLTLSVPQALKHGSLINVYIANLRSADDKIIFTHPYP